jgi:hypothetical protein
VKEEDRCVVVYQDFAVPLELVLRELARIKCLCCDRGGLEHYNLDHTLVDPHDHPDCLN